MQENETVFRKQFAHKKKRKFMRAKFIQPNQLQLMFDNFFLASSNQLVKGNSISTMKGIEALNPGHVELVHGISSESTTVRFLRTDRIYFMLLAIPRPTNFFILSSAPLAFRSQLTMEQGNIRINGAK